MNNMKNEQKAVNTVVKQILEREGCFKAVCYIDDKTIVRATRRCYRKKILSYPRYNMEILITIGRPNCR